jgi:hypothetical protein
MLFCSVRERDRADVGASDAAAEDEPDPAEADEPSDRPVFDGATGAPPRPDRKGLGVNDGV